METKSNFGNRQPVNKRIELRARMTTFLSRIFIILTFVIPTVSQAEPAPIQVRAEIASLFQRLHASGCQFNRNGTWYTATEAQKHLSRKLSYFEDKNLIKTTEDFIALAATNSSSSGKAYLVRCAEAQPLESKVWLQQQLALSRQGK